MRGTVTTQAVALDCSWVLRYPKRIHFRKKYPEKQKYYEGYLFCPDKTCEGGRSTCSELLFSLIEPHEIFAFFTRSPFYFLSLILLCETQEAKFECKGELNWEILNFDWSIYKIFSEWKLPRHFCHDALWLAADDSCAIDKENFDETRTKKVPLVFSLARKWLGF